MVMRVAHEIQAHRKPKATQLKYKYLGKTIALELGRTPEPDEVPRNKNFKVHIRKSDAAAMG